MKITITTKKAVFDDTHGRLSNGDTVELPDHKANFYIKEGLAMCYQTKVMQDRPYQAVGATESLSASPAVQVQPQTTVSESADGAKKRGRKPKQS